MRWLRGAMAKPTGFLEFGRELPHRRPVAERVHDWLEVYESFPTEALQQQAKRVTVISTLQSRPPMVADELRRQADIFLDIMELQPKIGRDPAERAARDPRIQPRTSPTISTDGINRKWPAVTARLATLVARSDPASRARPSRGLVQGQGGPSPQRPARPAPSQRPDQCRRRIP